MYSKAFSYEVFDQQAQQSMSICREYIVGLSMEIARKELPKVLMYVHTLCYTQYVAATGHGKMMTFLDKIICYLHPFSK